MKKILEIASEILEAWQGPSQFKGEKPKWDGPSGDVWCKTTQRFVSPGECDCPECEALYETDHHPSKYLRPTDISW